MAGTFTQLYCHAVTAVKFRQAQIDPQWERRMFGVMSEALRELGHLPIIINGTRDHVHLLWRHNKTRTFSETMKIVKGRSSHFVNHTDLLEETFRWQQGYSAFSISVDRVPTVARYIRNQKAHHAKQTLHEEHRSLLMPHGEKELKHYLFDPLALKKS